MMVNIYSKLAGCLRLKRLLALLCCLYCCQAYAWQTGHKVTGMVQNEKGETLPGVSVKVEHKAAGYTSGTSTNEKGVFVFPNLPAGGPYSFTFTYIGYENKVMDGYIVKNGEKMSVIVQMKERNATLNQVVVIGYGNNIRKNITTAISSVQAADVSPRNASSANQLLQGQVAGVNLTMSNGTPGGASRVSIRGISSINGDNEPLYVIDGIPLSKALASYNYAGEYRQDPLSMINPADIASIDILKDAAAAAIYGSRATNGVVLITTKRGKKGKPQISVSQLSGVQTMPKKLGLMNPQEYIALQQEATANFNRDQNLQPGDSKFVDINKVLGKVPDNPYDVNWQDLVINNPAQTHQTDFAFSGANDFVNYYTSAGYQYVEGLLKNSSMRRYSVRTNVDFTPNKILNFGLRVGGNYTKSTSAPNGDQGTALLQRSLEQRPYDRPFKDDGSYYIGGKDILRHNGVQVLANDEIYDKNYQALVNLYGNIRFLQYFTFHSNYNMEARIGRGFRHQTRLHPYAFDKGATFDVRNTRLSQSIDNTLTFNKQWKGDFTTEAMVGYSFYKDNYDFSKAEGREFPSDDFKNITSATVTVADGDASAYAMESYIGRVMLGYKERYFISSSVRYDGSSKFFKDNRYATFTSLSGGWVFSNESFFNKPSWMDFGKLRASWGQTGNQDGIDNFSYLPLATGGSNYDQKTGLAIKSLGNMGLRWETATQWNLGTDLTFFQGKLNITYDYFNKKTNNLLYDLPTLASTGFTKRTANIGAMQNTGHEIGINSVNMEHPKFRWSTNFNISFIKNKVTSLIDDKPTPVGNWNAIIAGQPLGVFYGYQQLGIYQTLEEIPQSLQKEGVRPGDIRYADLDNNGIINSADLTVIGSPLPKFSGGITNNFKIGNFDISLLTTFSQGNKLAAEWRMGLDHMGAYDYNAIKDSYDQRWTGPGTSNTTPRAVKSAFNNKRSRYYLEDASFFRIRNLTVGYQLPAALLNRFSVQQLRLFVSCSNLYTFTKYSGYDPEAASSLDARSFGIDNLVTPQPRGFMVGINMNF